MLAALLWLAIGGQPGALPHTEGRASGAQLRLETVFPRLAGKNHVRWFDFDWRWFEFEPVEGAAPVRLYFYEQARTVAGLARAFTADAYREFVDRFGFKPPRRVPYLIYNSHFEFESTNAFFVSEHVLGVTSTVDLTMALPYWGEHRRFLHVMRHELAHQFHIQMVRAIGEKARCSPLERYPLWFIEGLAQFFAVGGLNPEVRTALADRMLDRPDSRRGGLPRFFDAELALSFERVYLIGHAQVVFLEEMGGPGTIRRLLEKAAELCGDEDQARPDAVAPGFPALVVRTLGLTREQLETRWRSWVMDQTADLLRSRHPLALLTKVQGIPDGDVDSYVLAPDRRTVLYRLVDRQTARTRLYLQDLEAPASRTLVAEDQRPGLISLHPIGRRVMAIGRDVIAYVGRTDVADALFVRRYRREEKGARTRYALTSPRKHELWRSHGLIELGHPAIHPDGDAVAVVGLDQRSGFLDIFRVESPFAARPRLVPLTADPYAERDLAYEPGGTLLFASDATAHRGYELFRLDDGGRTQVTAFGPEAELQDPFPLPGGEILVGAALADVPQAYRLVGGAALALSDVPTALATPAFDADGDLLGIVVEVGRRALARLPRDRLLEEAVAVPEVATGPPWELPLGQPEAEIRGERPYEAFKLANYRLQQVFLFGGSGPFLLGLATFADILKDHVGGLRVEVLGEWERTNALLFFVDRSGRWGVGGSAFVRTGFQLVPPNGIPFLSGYLLQRVGAAAQVEYPFGFFSRLEGYVSPQAIRAFDFTHPDTSFAQEHRRFVGALEVGGRFALDTLRLVPPLGPTDGVSLLVDGSVTQRFARASPFAHATAELSLYRSLSRSDRVYLYGRLGAGTSFGDVLAEQFFLPPVYNLRAFPPEAIEVFGRQYYLATGELRVPLDFLLPFLSYVEGLGGFDFGSVAFGWERAWRSRVAAWVLGFNFGISWLQIRLHFARPVDVGGGISDDEWLTHFTLLTPFLFF